MLAQIANGTRPCGQCGNDIQAGDPLYLVTIAKLVRCEACAWKLGGPLPEPQRPVQPPSEPIAMRFPRQQMADQLRRKVVDARTRQVGSE